MDSTDVLFERTMPDGRVAIVMPLTYGKGRIGIGPAGEGWLDDVW